MDANIIVPAIIAFIGVLISVFLGFISGKRTLKVELEKVYRAVEQDYATRLFSKRVDSYQSVYKYLSDFIKYLKYGEAAKVSLKEFLTKLNSIDSEYGVLFSSNSSLKLHILRKHIRKLNNENIETESLSQDDKTTILEKVGAVEIALKNELGIYAVEFSNLEKNITYHGYKDLDKERGWHIK